MSGWDDDPNDLYSRFSRAYNTFAKQLGFAKLNGRPTFWLRAKALFELTWKLIAYIIRG